MSEKLINAIAEMDDELAVSVVKDLIAQGTDPMSILDDCRSAMEIVGKRFEKGEYFISELILAGEMLKAISAEVKPLIKQEGAVKKSGKILIGTVKGDIHDIAKDIVVFMLDVNGFEVKDLGIDVPVETFVEEVKSYQPDVVALSGFLTLAYTSMKETVEAIEKAGLRDKVKIMVGGGTIDAQVCAYAKADGWGTDAMTAISLAKQWVGGK
ncbi:MAG: methionine synthase [Chloroflexi bacterium HGW-Chloroflexi-10]|nr:MAG: methionine synthase [Chloroflexi bacterium HGW-Chloroflexi-10]